MITAGVAVALTAAVANALAVVLQASEARRSPLGDGARAALLIGLARRPRWLAGTAMMIVAWPLQLLALTLAPITLVQPALATGQLVLLGIARVKLRERVGIWESAGALAIVIGVSDVLWSAPRHTVENLPATSLAIPLLGVGLAATAAYGLGRARPRLPIALVLGAGLAYAWVDFANKLLAGAVSHGQLAAAGGWLLATVAVGGLAFLQETTALQRRSAVTVAPVVAAVHAPLPVLMALAAGLEEWGSAPHRILPLAGGLAVIGAGAFILGRSPALRRVCTEAEAPVAEHAGAVTPRTGAARVRDECPAPAPGLASPSRRVRRPCRTLSGEGTLA